MRQGLAHTDLRRSLAGVRCRLAGSRRLAATAGARGTLARALLASLCVLALTAAGPLASAAAAPGERPVVRVVDFDLEIGEPAADWAERALREARRDRVTAVVFRIDTPGGLDSAMRRIVKAFIASPIPVVAWVAPRGARAASAGLFIVQAADVAAMAPETNIGSATPISLAPSGDGRTERVLGRKITNDAAAYVRALAEGHGRNADLAEQMVRRAVNVTAREAARRHLVDVVAGDERELLRRLDGFRLRGPKAGTTLRLAGARLEQRAVPFRYRALTFLFDPNTAFVLLTVGILGLALELATTGVIVPGTVGAVALLLGLFGLSGLPTTAAGLLLLAVAAAMFAAEAVLQTHGALGVGGAVALAVSGLVLFDTDSGAAAQPFVSVTTAAAAAAFFLFVAAKAARARRAPARTGREELLGAVATVREPLAPVGQVFTHGELWRARSADGSTIERGRRVVVRALEGLTLVVEPERDSQAEAGAVPSAPER